MTPGRKGERGPQRLAAALGALFAVALAASLAALWPRHLAEEAMGRVAVVVDGAELRSLAESLAAEQAEWSGGGESAGQGAAGRSAPGERRAESIQSQLLARLRELGVTGVGVYEWTLQDAAARGQAFVVSRATLEAMGSPLAARLPSWAGPDALIVGWTEAADPWVAAMLEAALPPVAVRLDEAAVGSGGAGGAPGGAAQAWLLTGASPAQIVLGLHPEEVRAVEAAGLAVVPRLRAGSVESSVEMRRRLSGLSAGRGSAAGGLGPVVFWGTSVAGFPSHLGLVAQELAAAGAAIGLIEFAPQQGLSELAKLLDYRVVRVHSITDREMAAGITPRAAVDRWLRAVRERQVRLLYVRFFLPEPGESGAAGARVSGASAAGALPSGGRPAAEALERNLGYIQQLTAGLVAAGYGLGMPEPVQVPPTPLLALGLIALAAGACGGALAWIAGAWVWRGFVPAAGRSLETAGPVGSGDLSRPAGAGKRTDFETQGPSLRFLVWSGLDHRLAAPFTAAGAVLTLAAFWGLWLKGYTALARQGLALIAALTFPAMAALVGIDVASAVSRRFNGRRSGSADSPEGGPEGGPAGASAGGGTAPGRLVTAGAAGATGRLVGAAAGFAAATLVSLVGAALVAAALTEVRFLLKIEEFRGVKLAHVAPLAAVGAVLAARVAGFGAPDRGGRMEEGGAACAGGSLGRRLLWAARFWLNRPIRVSELLVALCIAAVLWIYVVRTGNEGLPVPAIEASLRAFLEERLAARPRTKEFLIGHPALLVALAYWRPWAGGTRRRRFAAAALALLGTIGQISMVNTFAHAHSALAVSAARTWYGLVLGFGAGAAAIAAIEAARRLAARRAASGGARGAGQAAPEEAREVRPGSG